MEDVAFLEQYILNELNVQTLTVSADRERYHVRVRIALSSISMTLLNGISRDN